ncbi:MAG: hypothetical protein N2316_03255 [Spirochaetes bacterium]|nr:hypothetical protein [Spirochaetota bacterium]
MILLLLFLLLAISVIGHIASLIFFIRTRENRYVRWFANTAIVNIFIAGIITVYVIYDPTAIRGINLGRILWLISGIITFIMLTIQIVIFKRLFKRMRDPAYYHYNYFGKKVLNSGVVTKNEVFIFFFSIPFLLLFGSFFVAKIINYIKYGSSL